MTDLSFLRPVFDAPGPFASAHVDVSRTTESAAREVALRWRAVREDLLAAGAAEAVLAQLDPVLAAVPHAPGAAYRLVVANASGVLLDDVLPGPAGRPEGGTWGPMPDVAPLLVHRASGVPYVLAVVDRLGAEIEVHHVVPGPPADTETVQGDSRHVTKVAAGYWAHTQFQRRSENLWQRNAREVAAAAEQALARSGAELLVVTGDVRAREALRDALAPPARDRLVELPGDRRAAGPHRGGPAGLRPATRPGHGRRRPRRGLPGADRRSGGGAAAGPVRRRSDHPVVRAGRAGGRDQPRRRPDRGSRGRPRRPRPAARRRRHGDLGRPAPRAAARGARWGRCAPPVTRTGGCRPRPNCDPRADPPLACSWRTDRPSFA
ncbi:MAG: Vms1/Ankzf1 family peptidyl-tRNA hydrolase [Actinomycetota bacterium]